MKRLLFGLMSRVGTLLSHRQRRFVLDRLRLGRLVGGLAAGEFDEALLPNGLTVLLNPLLHAHLADNGEVVYEDDVMRALEEHLAPGGVFYDVGANVGVFALAVATRVGDAGAVHAFEPEENNLVCIRRSLGRSGLGNFVLHECAVGAEDGSMTFDRRGGAFSGRLVEPGSESRGAVVTVPVRSLDSVVDEGAPPPTLVKIDVEGGEGAVVEGMRRTLERHGPVVLCELHAFNPGGVRRTVSALLETGYALRGLDGGAVDPEASPAELPRHVLATPA